MAPDEPVNPYAPPSAELDIARPPMQTGSLENAIQGRYDFTVGDVMDEAWALVKGMKASFWGAAIVLGLISWVVDTIGNLAFAAVLGKENAIATAVASVILRAMMTPLWMGLYMMCVRRALGAPISFSTAFAYFNRSGVVITGALLVTLLTYLGIAALIIPGIYLGVGYSLWLQLACDQELPAWQAMETSRKAIHHKWWSVFGLTLLVGLLTGISALLLFIPLIWTLPWFFMVYGVLYRRIFFAGPPPGTTPPAPVMPAGPPPA